MGEEKSPSVTRNTSISLCTPSNSVEALPSSATTSKGLPNFSVTSDSSSIMNKFLVKPSDIRAFPRSKSSNTNRRVKTGARVLTSSEILSLLKQKEDKKKKETEDKERKKEEKEDRKRLREEEAKKKAEERKNKAEERAKKAADARAARASNMRNSSKRGRQTSTTSSVKKARNNLTSTESTSNPATEHAPTESQSTLAISPSSDCVDEIVLNSQGRVQPALSELCGVCYEPYCYPDYCDWIQCACGQWSHEDCVDEIVTDENGEERFCPRCVV